FLKLVSFLVEDSKKMYQLINLVIDNCFYGTFVEVTDSIHRLSSIQMTYQINDLRLQNRLIQRIYNLSLDNIYDNQHHLDFLVVVSKNVSKLDTHGFQLHILSYPYSYFFSYRIFLFYQLKIIFNY